ncbi:MAG TPA: hypothetical protein VHB99_05485 [Pirellulales bacterium]|nr:hypothetical protein [Pirellulales bacterium]
MSDTSGIFAPGGPGHSARWTSSAKEGVGSSISMNSRVWFTHSHGIVNEIYYPRVDRACIRDLGMIVTDGREFFSEEKRDALAKVEYLADGAPAYRITNTCKQGRYAIEKEMLTDPARDVFLQRTRFRPLEGGVSDYQLFMILAPHLGNRGAGNTAWLGEYKGVPMMFATRDGLALAVACSVPWLRASVGYVGVSDGWQDLIQHKRLTWSYQRAEDGNVALVGQIDLAHADEFVLAVGFGHTTHEAAHRAAGSMLDGFPAAKEH